MLNPVKEKLRAGQPTLGTWLSLPDPVAARFVAALGFDWVNVDLEHYPISIETAAQQFTAITAAGALPTARVPWNTPENIKRVLDCGALGVVAPMVKTRAEAEALVAAVDYPPAGNRSVGGALHAANAGVEVGHYYANANDFILVVAQIEHIEAVECIDDILSVPGIDAAFIGPADLAKSMSLVPGEDLDHPEMVAAIQRVRESAVAHDIAPGIHVLDTENANRRIAEGFQFIALASDLRFMVGAAQQLMAGIDAWSPRTEGEVARY